MLKSRKIACILTGRFIPWLTDLIIIMMVRVFKSRGVSGVFFQLRLLAGIFGPWLGRYYASGSAEFLAEKICSVKDKDFTAKFITHQLVSKYIKCYLSVHDWKTIRPFVHSSCCLNRRNAENISGNLLLHTHTGDYWLSVLFFAMQYEGRNCDFIVPVYQEITRENQMMYDKIDIPGVNVIFMNIHNKGALLKITRAMKDPDCVVAVFFDLSCYIAGVFNGAVNSLELFGKNGYMTLGILQLARKYSTGVSFVSSEYAVQEGVFWMTISDVYHDERLSELEADAVLFLERSLKRTPWQWHFISYIDTYYHYPYFKILSVHKNFQSQYESLNDKYLKK